MLLYHSILQLVLLSLGPVRAISLPHATTRSQQIEWGPCGFNGSLPITCAKLPVPLDYTNESNQEVLQLNLIKVDAAIQPSKGSIIFNFGGPGGDGLHNLGPLADIMQSGTGNSTLTFSCYATDLERTIAALRSPQAFGNSSDTQLGRLWAEEKLVSDACYGQLNKTGSLVGTAFVARDIMKIVDALDEDGLLRYYGFSYGTILGATVAAMFPDKMERVILDGVANPHEYYHAYDGQQLTDTDKTFAGFLKACVEAGSSNCALAHKNTTAAELEATFTNLFETLKYNPIALGGTIIDYTFVKNTIFNQLYYPKEWPGMAVVLDALLTGNWTTLELLVTTPASTSSGFTYEAYPGIKCSDKAPRASNWHELLPAIDQLSQESKWFGDLPAPIIMLCAQWQFAAKERYAGDFNVKTRHPVLLIGNTYDPTAPLVSARNVSASLEGSVVLQHDGYGHMSWVQRSNCTDKAVQNYFVNGTLPAPGTVCEPDVPLFPSTTAA